MSGYNLVFSGSAALYPAHLGAAQAIYERVFKAQLPDALVGTSGGAIVAAFLATGQRPRDGLPLLRQLLPGKLLRKNWAGIWDRLLRRPHPRLGLFNLEQLEACLEHHVPKTFAQAAIPLYLTAADLMRGELVIFNGSEHPTMPVVQAARISASMPGIFPLTPFEDRCLTDGGLLNNYPVDVLRGPTLGVLVREKGSAQGFRPWPKNELDLAIRCIEAMMSGLQREHVEDAETWARTVVIDVPWKSLDFQGLTAEVIDTLYMEGYNQASRALEKGVLLAI